MDASKVAADSISTSQTMTARYLLKRALWVTILIGILYFAIPMGLLHGYLDRLIFSSQIRDITHEFERYGIAAGNEANIIVRRYDGSSSSCVFFFPGQRGGIGTYERTLSPCLRESGVTIFAVSYPGQGGARGQAHLAQLPDQVENAVRSVAHHEAHRGVMVKSGAESLA